MYSATHAHTHTNTTTKAESIAWRWAEPTPQNRFGANIHAPPTTTTVRSRCATVDRHIVPPLRARARVYVCIDFLSQHTSVYVHTHAHTHQ